MYLLRNSGNYIAQLQQIPYLEDVEYKLVSGECFSWKQSGEDPFTCKEADTVALRSKLPYLTVNLIMVPSLKANDGHFNGSINYFAVNFVWQWWEWNLREWELGKSKGRTEGTLKYREEGEKKRERRRREEMKQRTEIVVLKGSTFSHWELLNITITHWTNRRQG